MLEFLNQYLSSGNFIPHGHCYLWKPALVWLHLLSDSLITVAYYSIPVMLIYFIRQRRDVPFTPIFWMFGAFIAACGTTHLLAVWTLWHPIYWVSGTVKAFTAFISLYTASELFELIPQALNLPSPEELQEANEQLSAEIQERKKAQAEILTLNAELEQRVAERTAELEVSNQLKERALISERQAREEAESSKLESQNFASRLTLAMEIAKMGSWDWDLKTGKILWTPYHEIIFGYEPGRGKYLYEEWRERIHSEDLAGVEEDLIRAKTEKRNYEGEYRVIWPDKSLRWVFSLGRFLYQEDGIAARMVGMSIDITDRKQSEERFRVSQELSLDAFAILRSLRDDSGYIVDFEWIYLNPKAGEILKNQPEKLVGQTLLSVLPGNKYDSEMFDRYVRVVESGEPHDIEIFYDSEGIRGWFRNMAVKLDDGIAIFFSDITERKYAEIAIKESEKRYATLAQLSPVGIFRCDRSGNCFYVNESWLLMTGLSCEEAKGNGWVRAIHPDDFPRVEEQWRRLIGEHLAFELEYRLRKPDGSNIWVLGQALPEIETQGEIISYIGTVTDISASKQNEAQRREAERALRESQRFIQRIAETTPGLLYIYDLKEGRNIYVNGQVSTILGYDQSYIQGIFVAQLLEHFHPDDVIQRSDFLRRLEASQDNEVYSFEFRFLCGDGQWRWLCSYETVFSRDSQGKPLEILGIALDVSQRKLAEIDLYKANERYQLATAAVNCLIYDVDLTSRTVERTAAMADIVGYTPEEADLSIDWWTSIIHPDDVNDLLRRFYLKLKTVDRYSEEYRVRHKCGDYRWVRDQGLLVRDIEGTPIRMVGSTTDITEAKEAQLELERQERELRQLTELLKKRNQELDGFAYIVSHDLKAPLRAIANLSEWIEEDLEGILSEDNRQQMALLRQRVYRMESLINGLLDYSRAGRDQLTAQDVNVENLLVEIIDSLSPPKSFEILVTSPMPRFTAKRLLLSQVFANLIGNAIKHHHRAGGKIIIGVRDEGDFYQFTVQDDGPGIPPEYHAKIFGIFQTLKDTESNESTGLGLSIVKRIIETEGGAIELESAPGKGSRFRFTWPKYPQPETDS